MTGDRVSVVFSSLDELTNFSVPFYTGHRIAGVRAVGMMDGMSATMGGMAVLWMLLVILLVLGIAALVKYLVGTRR